MNLFLLAFSEAKADNNSPYGIATLALLKRGYPVEDVARVLRASNNPAFAFVHKVFGNHYENLEILISDLTNNHPKPDPHITVIVYLDCGPCRTPRRPGGFFPVIAPRLDINQLNRLLERTHKRTLSIFKKEARFLRDRLPIQSNVSYIIIPSLEDNLTARSYAVMASIQQQVFAGIPQVTFGRNRNKNAPFRSSNPIEFHGYHIADIRKLVSGDIVNGDGEIFCFKNETNCTGYSQNHLLRWAKASRKRSLVTLIWRPETQGLTIKGGIIPLNRRKYRVPFQLHDLLKQIGE